MKLNWKVEGHSYTNCLVNIFPVLRKFLYFQFLTRGKRKQIPIRIGAQNRRIIRQKIDLVKNNLLCSLTHKLKVNYVSIAYCFFENLKQTPSFQILNTWLKNINSPIVTWVPNRRIYNWKNGHILLKKVLVLA